MKILVNSGNIGTPVAEELARAGHAVSLAVRKPTHREDWLKLGLKQVPFDIDKPDSMVAALKGQEVFFSITPLVENFVAAGTNTMLAAKQAGVRRIVRSSAQGAGPDARILLGRWHYAVEQKLEETGIPFTILRPANFMQNYLTFGTPQSIKTQSAFYSSIGDAKVSMIDTRDISAAAVRVILDPAHQGNRYELTGGESLSNDEVAALFSKHLSRQISCRTISDEQFRAAMVAGGSPRWLTELIVELNGIGRAGYLAAVKPDTELVLGRKPITFERFLRDNLSVFQN